MLDARAMDASEARHRINWVGLLPADFLLR
jgi:hypothetical protein